MAHSKTFTTLATTKVEDDLHLTFIKGDRNDTLVRDSIDDRINKDIGNYDTESSKVFYAPIRLALVRGSIETAWEWEEGDLTAFDIERFKTLNQSDYMHQESEHAEASVANALASNKFISNMKFFPQSEPVLTSYKWQLATKCTIKALENDTRFLCTLTDNPNYTLKYFDILAGESREIPKNGSLNYLAFSRSCTIGDNEIAENSIKKLSSDTINVTNTESQPMRVVSVYK